MGNVFSKRLRELRGKRSQSEICVRLGVKQGAYSTWELGKYEPPYEVLVRIAVLYGVSTDYLLGMPVADTKVVLAKLESAKRAFFKLNEAVKELEGIL